MKEVEVGLEVLAVMVGVVDLAGLVETVEQVELEVGVFEVMREEVVRWSRQLWFHRGRHLRCLKRWCLVRLLIPVG